MTHLSIVPTSRKLLRPEQIMELTGLSRRQVLRVVPHQRRLGPRTVRWYEEDVIRWLDSLSEKAS